MSFQNNSSYVVTTGYFYLNTQKSKQFTNLNVRIQKKKDCLKSRSPIAPTEFKTRLKYNLKNQMLKLIIFHLIDKYQKAPHATQL